MLSASMQASNGAVRARSARIRARGTGHRRRFTQGRASRSSVYETIEEEPFGLSTSPSPATSAESSVLFKRTSIVTDSIYVVEGDTASIMSDWDDEHGIIGMRQYYALKDEATETVDESKRVWPDTPFSIFAIQSKRPSLSSRHTMSLTTTTQTSNRRRPETE